jgi:hypothetical protein
MRWTGLSIVRLGTRVVVNAACLCLCLTGGAVSAAPPAIAPPPTGSGGSHVCSEVDGVLPPNVTVRDPFQDVVRAMLTLSPTFRAQCARIAAAPHLRVVMRLDLRSHGRGYGARTTFTFGQAGEVMARIEFVAGVNYAPIVGHEFEHVLEQLDRWHLPGMAAGGDGVHEIAPGIYETQRAIRAGHRVESEMFGRRRSTPVTAPET